MDFHESGAGRQATPSNSLPTLPFEEAEIDNMLAAAGTFTTNGCFGPGNRKRIRAMILLLRYSGLRISDASTLERARVNGTKLFLYTQKTGTPVRMSLPQTVVDALAESPSEDTRYYFWNVHRNAKSTPSSRHLLAQMRATSAAPPGASK